MSNTRFGFFRSNPFNTTVRITAQNIDLNGLVNAVNASDPSLNLVPTNDNCDVIVQEGVSTTMTICDGSRQTLMASFGQCSPAQIDSEDVHDAMHNYIDGTPEPTCFTENSVFDSRLILLFCAVSVVVILAAAFCYMRWKRNAANSNESQQTPAPTTAEYDQIPDESKSSDVSSVAMTVRRIPS